MRFGEANLCWSCTRGGGSFPTPRPAGGPISLEPRARKRLRSVDPFQRDRPSPLGTLVQTRQGQEGGDPESHTGRGRAPRDLEGHSRGEAQGGPGLLTRHPPLGHS